MIRSESRRNELNRSKQLSILIVEDEVFTSNTLSFVLVNGGYQVLTASNGWRALQIILGRKRSKTPIELMILDLEIPGLTGFQLLDELRNRNIIVPTIAITGLLDSFTLQGIHERKCQGLLKKPFSPEDILNCIQNTKMLTSLVSETDSQK